MNVAHSIPSTVSSISFSSLSSQDIRRISVKQIVNPVLLDDLNRPNVGGLYDPALGPSDPRDICATCRLNYFQCPGHFGHVELPAPVYHPLFMINMFNVLRGTCLFCHKFKLGRSQKKKYMGILKLLEHGLLEAARALEAFSEEKLNGSKEDEMDQDEDVPDSAEEYENKIHLFVTGSLERAPGSRRDDYKDGQVYQARKDIIAAFLRLSSQKKCRNCHAFAYTFRKEGHAKIIELDLSIKHKESHKLLDMKRPNVFSEDRTLPSAEARIDEGYVGSDSDGDSDEEDAPAPQADFSDQEEEDEGDSAEQPTAARLPRAANGKQKTIRGRDERVLTAEECRAHLHRLFRNEAEMCSLVFGRHGPFASMDARSGKSLVSADMFFMDVVPISPTRFRPPAKLGETLFEHPQNMLLTKIIQTSYRLRDLNLDLRTASAKGPAADPTDTETIALERNKILSDLIQSLVQLQIDVNSFMDSNKNPAPMRQGQLPPMGVKQILEKKEGLFRKHMMGKRVNHAARSVISPDVNIETNEIGIPPVFARTLTFPVPVTDANVAEMRQLVINGPVWPGASMVELEDGSLITLAMMSVEQRTALANQLITPQDGNKATSLSQGLTTRSPTINKKVYRHLQDGDILILNRQPTLHKPSMMAHKAKVLKGEKTIRMHYANCNSYNADFDGDEMNIHFPQNQIPRAEGMMIANTDNQYLVPTSGAPLRGLIQDHVVAGVWMTNKQTFFTREEYHQIIFGALRPEDNYSGFGKVITIPPAIWKPQPLWTGKQIISTIMKNISPVGTRGLNLRSKSKVANSFWGPHSAEQEVIFADGELVCGVLDKSQFGATSYGLMHAVYELYGAETAGKLLSILSRLFSKFLQHRAFTCRMDDLALTPAGEASRKETMRKGSEFGTIAAVENFPTLADPNLSEEEKKSALRERLEEVLRDDNKMAGLDMTVKGKMKTLKTAVDDQCIPGGLLRKFPDNHMQTMVMTGAKGSSVNAGQISSALGQQELEGRRVPVMVSGKTLPSFKAFETAAIAGGYIGSRFLTGLRPQEFYFHCMAGREGLIDTAVKTSRSGYLQRCLIKHLEGIRVHYDHTVRGSDSSIFQFQYGGDGLDVTKQKYLLEAKKQQDELFYFAAQNQQALSDRIKYYELAGKINEEDAVAYMKKALKKPTKYPPPLSVYSPSRYLGATSERYAASLNSYIADNPHGVIQKPKQDNVKELSKRRRLIKAGAFRGLMQARYLRSLVDPGEAVGLLASQGVGEPSTQMTLNTFHFAGHGAANVTLGIPRLREIVMTASIKPKTPTMTLPVALNVPLSSIDDFCKKASRLTLSQVVDVVTVEETLVTLEGARNRNFKVTIELFPRTQYEDEYKVQPKDILRTIGKTFGGVLKKEILVELKKLGADLKAQAAGIGRGQAPRREVDGAPAGEDDDDGDADADAEAPTSRDDLSEVGDGDADDAKRARQQRELSSYDDDEDDDEEASNIVDIDMDDLEAEFASDDEDSATATRQEAATSRREASMKELLAEANNSFFRACGMAIQDSLTFQSKKKSHCTFSLTFPAETPKLLLVGIIECSCVKTVIHQIPGVSRCLHVKKERPDDDPETMMTEGSNFYGMWNFAGETVNLDAMESNDIYAILMTYGVEAARTTIVKEIQKIFRVYGIGVDARHIELIADYMTFDGGYKPFNRKGISTNSSPLLKASYETTGAFIADAVLYGDFDDLRSPSGSIVLGRPTQTGTGVFDVVTDFGIQKSS